MYWIYKVISYWQNYRKHHRFTSGELRSFCELQLKVTFIYYNAALVAGLFKSSWSFVTIRYFFYQQLKAFMTFSYCQGLKGQERNRIEYFRDIKEGFFILFNNRRPLTIVEKSFFLDFARVVCLQDSFIGVCIYSLFLVMFISRCL